MTGVDITVKTASWIRFVLRNSDDGEAVEVNASRMSSSVDKLQGLSDFGFYENHEI